MTEDIKQKDIKEEIIKRIENGDIKMRPRFYFVLKLIALVFLVISVFVTSIFLLSYILFSLSSKGYLFLLQFGLEGIYNFFITLPWVLLALNVFIVVILDRLLRSFEFGYRSPVLYLFIGTFIFITFASTLINLTSFHWELTRTIENKKIPFNNKPYFNSVTIREFPGSFRGFVLSIENNTFEMSYGTTSINVIADSKIIIEDHMDVGDLVFVAGKVIDNQIKAYGIKKLNK